MGIPWVKKIRSFYTPGRRRWREKFPAAEGGRQIFWVVPREFVPQMIFFACPCMILNKKTQNCIMFYKLSKGFSINWTYTSTVANFTLLVLFLHLLLLKLTSTFLYGMSLLK